jgi:hypothetical protein
MLHTKSNDISGVPYKDTTTCARLNGAQRNIRFSDKRQLLKYAKTIKFTKKGFSTAL